MGELQKTVLHDKHVALGATMVDFGGWHMPIQYPAGIVEEHLATRRAAGLFDVSHMGRFAVRGAGALAFLQHVLTNNAAALDPGFAQYTMIPNERGGALDDAYLYRFVAHEYLLVVNAANREADWRYFQETLPRFPGVQMEDLSERIAMLSLQGPASRSILQGVISAGPLPEPLKNALSRVSIAGKEVLTARTGYTGEPLGFECFLPAEAAPALWDLFLEKGAVPVGLGARDTLRLEAGLPLYGHELGKDPAGREIPIYACPLARFAVSFRPSKATSWAGRPWPVSSPPYRKIREEDYSSLADLPRIVMPFALTGKGIARAGFKVFRADQEAGFVTSGTMVPCLKIEGEGLASRFTEERQMRSIGLMLVDARLKKDDGVEIEIRGSRVPAVVVPYHLRSDAPPYARPIVRDHAGPAPQKAAEDWPAKVRSLLGRALENHRWRQQECINLIPSEQSASPMVRRLSILDPAGRYAEHRALRPFYDAEVFYYQGTDFIQSVEALLKEEMARFLGCREVEVRPVSGQMANTAVFSALLDYLNREDRKSEPRRIRSVLNNHIIRGGHLSAQPMGALRDFIRTDPRLEKPAVVNFPVLQENPYRIDVEATKKVIEEYRPELIIFGKSMVLHKEPVAEIRAFLKEQRLETVVMYDMAHFPGPYRAPLPGALCRGGRPGYRLDPQDLLRRPAGRRRGELAGGPEGVGPLGGDPEPDLPGERQQPSPGDFTRPPDGGLRDDPLPRSLPGGGPRKRQGLCLCPGRHGPGRGRRSRDRLHRDPSGRPQGGLCQRGGGGPAPRGEQHHLQLPGGPGRGGCSPPPGPSGSGSRR
jgi:aminomethyltransferase